MMKRAASFVRGFIFCWTVIATVGFYVSEKERKELKREESCDVKR